MAIPEFTNKYLPPGIYDCSFKELTVAFGTNDRRKYLLDNLNKYLTKVRNLGISGWIIVNGSFVTSKEKPRDIDVVLVLDSEYNFPPPLTVEEYKIFSQEHNKQEYELHVFVGIENDESSEHWIGVFSGVREGPDIRKGLLRVKI